MSRRGRSRAFSDPDQPNRRHLDLERANVGGEANEPHVEGASPSRMLSYRKRSIPGGGNGQIWKLSPDFNGVQFNLLPHNLRRHCGDAMLTSRREMRHTLVADQFQLRLRHRVDPAAHG
jgi:hypothetical protein